MIILPDNPNSQAGRSTGTDIAKPQAGQSSSPSSGTLAATALDNCHNSQLGDVVGDAMEQGGGPRVVNVPSNSATASTDNALGEAGEQGLRPRSTMEVPWPQLQLGPKPSRSLAPSMEENNLNDSSYKWVKNLSSALLTQA